MELESIHIVNLKSFRLLDVFDTVTRCNSYRSIGTILLLSRFLTTAIWRNSHQLTTNQMLYVR